MQPKTPLNKKKLLKFETLARSQGFKRIVGVDEAGRGPLAGPVVAAACMIAEKVFFKGINDSKLLSPRKRQALFKQLTTHQEVIYGVGVVDHTLIDELNIYQATKEAMRRALDNLKERPDYLLIDAVYLDYEATPCQNIIEGDRLSHSIAAASIIAKETRDALMLELHEQYPQYGFHEHKGYGTKRHLEALMQFGPCPIHRRSFAPVRDKELGMKRANPTS